MAATTVRRLLGLPSVRTVQGRLPSVDYELGPILGAGVHGHVQSATCRTSNRGVAIKTVHHVEGRQLHGAANIFGKPWSRAGHKEACMLAAVEGSPAAPRLEAVYETSNAVAIVMELCPGPTLQEHIEKRGALPEGQALDICSQLLSAVQGAHQGGVAHLDIKPANINIQFYGRAHQNHPRIKLTDFGSAEWLSDAGSTLPCLPGTGGYMAPELLQPGRAFHTNTDAYSIGCVLLRMLNGYRDRAHHPPPVSAFKHWSVRSQFPPLEGELSAFHRTKSNFPNHLHMHVCRSISDDTQSLVRALLATDPDARATIEQAQDTIERIRVENDASFTLSGHALISEHAGLDLGFSSRMNAPQFERLYQ